MFLKCSSSNGDIVYLNTDYIISIRDQRATKQAAVYVEGAEGPVMFGGDDYMQARAYAENNT